MLHVRIADFSVFCILKWQIFICFFEPYSDSNERGEYEQGMATLNNSGTDVNTEMKIFI
jgi:hypothetical protein